MKPTIMALSRALAAATLVGIADAQAATPYLASPESLAQIQVGATTAAKVREVLGEPLRMSKDSRRNWDGWQYLDYSYGQRASVWISFSSDGVVREIVRLQDRRPGTS